MQVLAFAQHVGSNEDVEFLIGRNLRALVVAHRAEAPGKLRRVVRVASDSGEAAYPTSLQLCGQVVHGVGKLGEDNKLLAPMLVSDEAEKRLELGIAVGVPVTALLQHRQQGGAIGAEIPGELRQEAVGTEPAKAPLERSGVLGIDLGSTAAEIGLGVQPQDLWFLVVVVFVLLRREQVVVCVGDAGIEQAGILGADGKRLIVLQGMQIDEIAQDVALDGL